MLSVADALEQVLSQATALAPVQVPLHEALGCVLAQPITSGIDSPPYDKSIVDGYALIAADISATGRELSVLEEVTAGMLPSQTVRGGTATRIMTGAPIPAGANAVVMVEQTEARGAHVLIKPDKVMPGQNIVRKATSLRAGQCVLTPGKLLRPMEIGLLAEVGCGTVSITPRPDVAVLVTGNELVAPSAVPSAGQIRNSNGPMLAALVTAAGANPRVLGMARDEASDLGRRIAAGLESDVLVLSGGVSAGVLDLVPAVLEGLGVRPIFHKINLKPGKPLWFGTFSRPDNRPTLVFGLPGNPISSLVCFELFVVPALQKLRNLEPTGLRRCRATLTSAHQQRGDRPTYWPSQFDAARGQVKTLPWKGSGDLRTLTDADCLALFPAGEKQYVPGEQIELLLL